MKHRQSSRKPPHPVRVFAALLEEYGPQGWWPVGGRYFPPAAVSREGRFEIILGAILTQNTAWRNADWALRNLREEGLVDPGKIVRTPTAELACLIRPSGYFNQKAARLREASAFFLPYLQRGVKPTREALLAVKGIGPETADSILLYAYGEPVFVVDAYTVRLARRLGLAGDKASYREVQALFTEALHGFHEDLSFQASARKGGRRKSFSFSASARKGGRRKASIAGGRVGGVPLPPADPYLFNEYHALIVRHGKERCAKVPRCPGCVLKRRRLCASGA